MVPEEAQRARDHIKELLIGHITAPFVVSSEQSIEAAKPSWPIETNMTLYLPHGDHRCMVLHRSLHRNSCSFAHYVANFCSLYLAFRHVI
jgi:hypothetical protein